jgi:hypothetical protein
LKNLKVIKSCLNSETFFEKMRKEGKYNLCYETNNISILENFGIKKSTTFQNHQELDQFVKKLIEKDSNFPLDYPNDYKFLKSFDRALWLRNYASKGKDLKSKPLMKDLGETNDCPFGDPHETGSIMKQ